MDTYESNMHWLVDTDGHDWEFGPLGYGHADDCRTCECDRMEAEDRAQAFTASQAVIDAAIGRHIPGYAPMAAAELADLSRLSGRKLNEAQALDYLLRSRQREAVERMLKEDKDPDWSDVT